MTTDKKELISTRRKSRKGVDVYRENPFWEPQTVKVGAKRITVAGGMHVNALGENVAHSGIHVIEEVDKDQFVKLYTKNVKAFFDIKPSTQKVLMAVINAIQKHPSADSIYLNWFVVEDYSLEHDLSISERSFYSALKELIAKGFLAESESTSQYWINPHLVFNGDRMTFIREYRRVDRKEAPKGAENAIDPQTNLDF